MRKLWSSLQQERNRQVLGWLGGGVVVLAGGVWVVMFFFSRSSPPQTPNFKVEAPGGVAAGRDIASRDLSIEFSPIVTASRIFAGPNEYPPTEFAAYGILAFRSRPSPYDRDRHLMFCNAYVATLPHAHELEVPRSKQMVTVWPLTSDRLSLTFSSEMPVLRKERLIPLAPALPTSDGLKPFLRRSEPEHYIRHRQDVDRAGSNGFLRKYICQIAIDNYGLVIAQQAIKDAELTGITLSRVGPFLLAWSPSADKGKQDTLVLVSDLSDITTYEQAQERFLAWSRDIESDHALWMSGWILELLRTYIRNWVDKYGEKSLAVFAR